VGTKVLLVEDDPEARQAIIELLSERGLEVLAADEGRKALELMEAWRPEIVLLDLHMVGMGGREFRDEQKRRGRLARIPVVIMTGDPDPAVEGNAMLTKPFTNEDLLGTMARFVPSLRARAVPSSA
jgi:two-component system cell cycle response regulator/two-component system cell cycle response regulator DivK